MRLISRTHGCYPSQRYDTDSTYVVKFLLRKYSVLMALNIKNSEVERLASELAALTGESKTEAVRRALEERKARVSQKSARSPRERWLVFLEEEVWPGVPAEELGRRLSREEEDALLGYGPQGL